MKLFLFAALIVCVLSSAKAADVVLLNCEATEIMNNSYFEESLSLEEYPEVQLIQDSNGIKQVWLGASLYSEDDAKICTSERVNAEKTILILPFHNLQQFQIQVNGNQGQLIARTKRAMTNIFSSWDVVANLNCK